MSARDQGIVAMADVEKTAPGTAIDLLVRALGMDSCRLAVAVSDLADALGKDALDRR